MLLVRNPLYAGPVYAQEYSEQKSTACLRPKERTLQFRCNLLQEKANSYPKGDTRGMGEGSGQTGAELALPSVEISFECLRRNYKVSLVISATMFTPIALLYHSDTTNITLIRSDEGLYMRNQDNYIDSETLL